MLGLDLAKGANLKQHPGWNNKHRTAFSGAPPALHSRMHTVLLTVGDEILLGQIVNTNAAWLGERLALAGADVQRSETVGDDRAAITESIRRATADGAELIVITGGLGATHDDLTKPVVADVFECPLVFRDDVLEVIEARYAARGRRMAPVNRVLAEVPEGFDVLPNPKGVAPGLWGERHVDGRRQSIVLMPGVPHEMKAISEASVLPRVRQLGPGEVAHRTVLTAGMGETDIAERLGDLSELLPVGIALAFLPSLGVVRIRLTAKGDDADSIRSDLRTAVEAVQKRLGDLVFGQERETLEGAVGELLVSQGVTLAVAESCTGGAIAARLTEPSGASRFLQGGVVAYCNSVKTTVLGVDPTVLILDGAVSETVALQMARGVRERLGADVGVSTTGIAGPTGGTPEKPVGTVWLGYSDDHGEHAVRLQLTTDRMVNIGLTTTAALNLIRRQRMRSSEVNVLH